MTIGSPFRLIYAKSKSKAEWWNVQELRDIWQRQPIDDALSREGVAKLITWSVSEAGFLQTTSPNSIEMFVYRCAIWFSKNIVVF